MRGPFNPPKAALKSAACCSLFIFIPKYFSPANLAAKPPIADVTFAYLLNLPPVIEELSSSVVLYLSFIKKVT